MSGQAEGRAPTLSRSHRSGWGVAIAATLGMSVSYIDRQTLAAIAPQIRGALAIDNRQFGFLLSAFSLAYLVGAPAAGVLVDRLGARRGFAIAVVAWSVVAGAHALVTSFAMLIALRVLLGAAEAPSFPAAAQAIRRSLPIAGRPAAYGLLFTGSSLGAMIAAPLAVTIASYVGFRGAFIGTSAIGLLWIPFWLAMTAADRRHTGDDPAPSRELADVAHVPDGAAKTVYRGPEPVAAVPTTWLGVVLSAPVLRAVVAVFGCAPAIMFVLNWSSLYLVDRWGLSSLRTRGYLVLPPLFFDVGAVGLGFWASAREKRHRRDIESGAAPPAIVGRTHLDLFLGSTVLAATLALAPLAPSPLVAMLLFSAAAVGGGGIYVLVTADMLSRVPLDRTSSAGGMTAAAQSAAHIIAAPLVGMAIDRTHGYGATLVALGLVVVPTSLAFALWPGIRAR